MKIMLCTGLASLLTAVGLAASFAQDEAASPAVHEVASAYEREAAAAQSEGAQEISRVRLQAIEKLQSIQDRLCRDAKLDEAVAVREQIRRLSNAGHTAEPPPAEAAEIVRSFELQAADVERKANERIEDAGRRAVPSLERLFEELCRQAKLDEAQRVREMIRRLTGKITEVRPDPGNIRAQTSDIGTVWYYEVVGNRSGSIYGTDFYTSDSSLASAAVHSGVLKMGEKGIVRVTIMAGRSSYPSTTRHGITSSAYGAYTVSFKVERAYGVVRLTLHDKTSALSTPYATPPPKCPSPPDVPRIESPRPVRS